MSERERFEAWARTQPRHEGASMRFLPLNNAYIDFDLHGAWLAWQAARSGQAASGSSQGARSDRTRSQKLADAGFTRRPSLWAMQARETLELIAAPQRPDGSWNRDREACRQLAAEALGRHTDSDVQNGVGQPEAPTAAPLVGADTAQAWKWMTHPHWNKGLPIPVLLTTDPDSGEVWYQPFSTSCTEFEWSCRDKEWTEVAAHPPARSGAGSEEAQPDRSEES